MRKKKKLAALHDAENNQDDGQVFELQKDLKILMKEEDLKWRQWAKMDWLKHGDRTRSFFMHVQANDRR